MRVHDARSLMICLPFLIYLKRYIQYFFLGHFLLTHLLLDLIKRSTPARVVVVASVAHTWTGLRLDDINSEGSYDPIKAYGQSKLANVLFARSLARRLQGEADCRVKRNLLAHFIFESRRSLLMLAKQRPLREYRTLLKSAGQTKRLSRSFEGS